MALISSWFILLLAILTSVVLILQWLKRELWIFFGSSSPNLFSTSAQRPRKPIEMDTAKRDKVMKQGFRASDVPKDLDAIVIGSGIGGLTVASLLAKAGKKVLVLEQHDRAGGCCHTYVEKGFEFDTGLHYIGEMHKGASLRFLMDEITEGQLEWAAMSDNFDQVVLGSPSSPKRIPIVKGRKEQIEELIKCFPGEEDAIRKFYKLSGTLRSLSVAMGLLKLAPMWLSKFLIATGIFKKIFPAYETMEYSLQEYLDKITTNKDLQAVLAYNCLDYGTFPSDAPAGMQFILCQHFASSGGYYPVGGSSEIPYVMVPLVERAGGRVMVRAPVTKILLDDSKKKAVGVVVSKGGQDHTIRAPLIVSSAGLKITCQLLSKSDAENESAQKTIGKVGPSVSCVQVFVGLKGTAEELGIPKGQNIWLWKDSDFTKAVESLEEDTPVLENYFPMSFISFPSTKDPKWEERFPGKSTCLIISGGSYKWFEEWKDSTTQHRGKDYEAMKKELTTILWNDLLEMYPQLEEKVEYMDLGTPLTFQYYIGAPTGEIYGLDHSVKRFSAETMAILRPETQYEGLFLAGQDVATCGIAGGMMGGILSASAILKRNIIGDLLLLRQRMKKASKKAN